VHELLKSQRKTLGRLDGRFAGPTQDPLQKYADYDPQAAAISAAFTAAFQDYYHSELKFGQGRTYRATNFDIGNVWKWTHKPIDADGEQPVVNSGVDLAQALVQDANLKVLVLNGYYDLATPFTATEYMMTHLGLPPGTAPRIQMKYYEAGHMMYVNPPSMKKMKGDLDAFIYSTHYVARPGSKGRRSEACQYHRPGGARPSVARRVRRGPGGSMGASDQPPRAYFRQ